MLDKIFGICAAIAEGTNSDTVNFFKHKFLLSGSNLPDIPAFHTAEFIFFLQVTGNR